VFVCRFFREHNEGSGCVVKMPYTTNREFCHFAKSEDVLIGTIRLAISRYTGIMPYVMVQPCMVNPRETKVVCWNGVAKWIAHNGSTRGKSISKFPHAELFRFVEMAIAELKQQCPAAIVNGLVRVDVFKNAQSSYVVNEFESLEAQYQSVSAEVTQDAWVMTELTKYWIAVIHDSLMRLMP
jgi:hypothetical protein